MASPTGILPEELMYPARLEDVIRFLEQLPIRGQKKEELLFGWARTVGVSISSGQRRRVRESGIDYSGPPPRR